MAIQNVVWKTMVIISIVNLFISITISQHHDFEELQSGSYFDELSRLSKYKQMADYLQNKNENGFSLSLLSRSQNYLIELFADVLGVSKKNYENLDAKDDRMQDVTSETILRVLKDVFVIGNASSTCIDDMGRFITNLFSGTPWALQFLDATGKPGPSITKGWWRFVGNYNQCRAAVAPPSNTTKTGFRGNYCVLSAYFIPGFNFGPQFGACLPSTCSSSEITVLVKRIARLLNISTHLIGDTQCLQGKTQMTTATIFAILILSLTGCLAILGTLYDLLYVQERSIFSPHFKENLNGMNSHSDCPPTGNDIHGNYEPTVSATETTPLVCKMEKTPTSSRSIAIKILLAFSFYTNGKKILSTSRGSGSLGSIHGIRFLSMSWVVLGHCFLFSMQSDVNITTEVPVLLQRNTFDVISNSFVSVDTFFTVSGLLISYLTIKELKRRSLRINWPMFYFHRFWRLTPPYMFTIVIVLGLQQYLGQGPFWGNEQPPDKTFCEKNWWTNLLYINNLVHIDESCFGHSWYLANDMQFFVLSPLMLIPFYFHRFLGFASCFIFLLVSWVTTGVLSYDNNWAVSLVAAGDGSASFFMDYYIVPWCRIGPYVVGIMAGYILAVTNGKAFRMRWWVVLIGWLLAIASALAVLYGIHGDIDGQDPSSRSVAALYNAVSRSVWGACVCWVIVACNAGYGGPVNALLSWSPFVALGRLTYMTYLIHLPLISSFFRNMGMPFYLNDTTLAILFLGLLVFSNMVSFVLGLLLESPMIGLEKAFLRRERQD